ncbi:hypothetical protein TSAR_011726 [Trichomalopsis sarcophagae]|uniref:Uncharacterized protein n=1 Tax=Trichomalopsis sarcophagae TaxID=543379 RepID=A0A232FC18_9HYME|nr:hypothetical protein TSAR_011726 [Trichomalopsis sarcophagae]
MFSKVISHFFDRSKKSRKSEFFGGDRDNGKNSMEWQEDDDDDRRSVESLSWIGTNDLEKSKSDSSIIPIGDCNYRARGVQVTLGTCGAQKKLTSALRNLDISNDDDDGDDERNVSFTPVITKDCPYNQLDSNSFRYGFKTQNLTTKELVSVGPEILNFQGNLHSPEEIAMYWKKDCRMWLWKSFRRRNQSRNTMLK